MLYNWVYNFTDQCYVIYYKRHIGQSACSVTILISMQSIKCLISIYNR